MADGYVQAPTDNTGKKVDSDETTNQDDATVERLRVSVPDGMKIAGDILSLLLREVQTTNALLAQAFGIKLDEAAQGIGDDINAS